MANLNQSIQLDVHLFLLHFLRMTEIVIIGILLIDHKLRRRP